MWTWENGGLWSYLPKPMVLTGLGRGGLFFFFFFFYFYPITLLIRPSPFIFLAFQRLSARTSSCAILANEGDSWGSLTSVSGSLGVGGVWSCFLNQEAWRCPSPPPASLRWTRCPHIQGSQ